MLQIKAQHEHDAVVSQIYADTEQHGRAEGAVAEERERQHRRIDATLGDDERDRRDQREHEAAINERMRQPERPPLDHGAREGRQHDDREQLADGIDAARG